MPPGSGGGTAGTRRRLRLQRRPRQGHSLLELLELLEMLARIMEVESQPVHSDPRRGDVRHTCADPSAARRDLGFECQVSFESGLCRTIDWFASRSLKR